MKNPHIKIPPKSPGAIFQSLDKIQNLAQSAAAARAAH
jgi:hypothetical protein